MTKHQKMVSVIVPVFNSEVFLKTCIESLLAQTYQNIEIICIDDGSTDNSKNILQRYSENNKRIEFVNFEKNCGVAEARNAGIKLAKGKYIAFCDSDDTWVHNKLELQIDAMNTTGLKMSHSDVIYKYDNENKRVKTPRIVSLENMRVRNYISNSSGIYNCDKLGKYYQQKTRHEDYIMWSEILADAGDSVGVQHPTVFISRREGSISSNKVKSVIWHFQAQRQIFNTSWFDIGIHFLRNVRSRIAP